MAKEIERKYLVADESWRTLAGQGVSLKQAYVLVDRHGSARVRISGNGAKLALKFGSASLSRDEFEYEIPAADAWAMMDLRMGNIIEKTRYTIPVGEKRWEVDEYHEALDGLVVAELELESEQEPIELPAWVGAEITGDSAYYNLSLARDGRPPSCDRRLQKTSI